MSLTNTETARQGGRFNADLGMLFTTTDVLRMGEMHLQSLMHFLMLLYYDEKEGVPASGFPRSDVSSDNCEATSTGALTYDVDLGWGMVFDASQLGSSEFGSDAYQMVALGALTAGPALSAHHATLARNDLICMKPLRIADRPATRNIKDPSSGALSTSSVNLRNRLGAEIVVVEGTPASTPVDPALPAGHLLVARALVPATAGTATIQDARAFLHIGTMMGRPGTTPSYLMNHVHPEGGANELLVNQTTVASLTVDVNGGRGVIGATVRYQKPENLTIAAAHATLDRIDLVSLKRDGTLNVTTGTPDASPVAPSLPAISTPLATVLVVALATQIFTADITDQRLRSWMNGANIRVGTMPHQKLTTPPWRVELVSSVTVSGDVKRVNYKVVYPDGTDWDGTFPLEAMVETYFVGTVGANQTIFAAANYDNTNASDRYMTTPHMEVHLPLSFVLFPYLNAENQGAVDAGGAVTTGCNTGRMKVDITAQTFSMEVCRDTTGSDAGEVYVAVHPTGPDGAPMPVAALTKVTFT